MKLRSMLFGGLLAVAGLALATPAHAAFIVGTTSFAPFGLNAGVTITANGTGGEIDWTQPANPGLDLSKTYGQFNIGGFTTLSFLNPVIAPTVPPHNFIQDMSSNPLDANYVPIGNSITPNFLMFPGTTWQFTETFLSPGSLVPNTPFQFSYDAATNQTTVAINLRGFAFDTTTPSDISSWVLVLSSQFNEDPNAVISDALAGRLQNVSWSGTITASAVPEPATLLTFGLGSLYMARRRRNQKKA